jgi:hypothetical protein
MFVVYGIPPHQTAEVKVTTRNTQAQADLVVQNLTGFGYTKVRVVNEGAKVGGGAGPVAPSEGHLPAGTPVQTQPAPQHTPPGHPG